MAGGSGGFAGVWLRRPGRRLRMKRLGGILQMTASTCWWSRRRCRTGGARTSSPERLRALLDIHAVADERVLRSWVACARRSCGIQPPTTDVYDSPNARAWPRTRPWRAGLPPGEQHADAFLARLAGMLIGALLRAVLAREAWTRFPARCFGSPSSCLGSPAADTLHAVQ